MIFKNLQNSSPTMEKVRLPTLADDQRTFPTEDSFWQGKPLLIPGPGLSRHSLASIDASCLGCCQLLLLLVHQETVSDRRSHEDGRIRTDRDTAEEAEGKAPDHFPAEDENH